MFKKNWCKPCSPSEGQHARLPREEPRGRVQSCAEFAGPLEALILSRCGVPFVAV